MVNLYPLITSSAADLPKEPDKCLIENNLEVLKAVKKSYYSEFVWAAWGYAIEKRSYLSKSLYEIQKALQYNIEWIHFGELTKKGNPRNPLRLGLTEEYNGFPVVDYLLKWNRFGRR